MLVQLQRNVKMESRSLEKEKKNKSERERSANKQFALQVIRRLIRENVGGEAGPPRWTEKYTLEKALELIEVLKASIREHGGNPNIISPPMANMRRQQVRITIITRGLQILYLDNREHDQIVYYII